MLSLVQWRHCLVIKVKLGYFGIGYLGISYLCDWLSWQRVITRIPGIMAQIQSSSLIEQYSHDLKQNESTDSQRSWLLQTQHLPS